MRLLVYYVLSLLFSFFGHDNPLYRPKGETHQLAVTFTNVKKELYGKKMYVAVWKKGTKGFPDVGTQDEYATFWLTDQKRSTSFELPKGTYAASCFLDLNGNKKLDYNFWGAPTEPFCFSENFTPSFSAPDFSDCDFYLSGNQEIKLKLIY